MSFDCGILGSFLLTNTGAVAGSATVNGASIALQPGQVFSTMCAGVLEVTVSDPAIQFLGMVSGLQGFSWGLLMGLAGIVCGGIIVYVILH